MNSFIFYPVCEQSEQNYRCLRGDRWTNSFDPKPSRNKMESWLSGRKRFTANEVGVLNPSRVQIPYSPQPPTRKRMLSGRCMLRESKGFEKSFWRSRTKDFLSAQKRRGRGCLVDLSAKHE